MKETDYKRAYFCLKKWVEEIQVKNGVHLHKSDTTVNWIVMTCENEIFNGEYLSDKEYNEILLKESGDYGDRV